MEQGEGEERKGRFKECAMVAIYCPYQQCALQKYEHAWETGMRGRARGREGSGSGTLSSSGLKREGRRAERRHRRAAEHTE